MAIVIRGNSKCGLCGEVISESDDVTAFSAFVVNEADELLPFNDAAFHSRCFQADPRSAECRAVYEECRTRLGPNQRVCEICDKEIEHYDNHFTVGYLTKDRNSTLYQFNYYQSHLTCLAGSDDAVRIHRALSKACRSGELKGPAVERLVQRITPENLPEEIADHGPVGKEVW